MWYDYTKIREILAMNENITIELLWELLTEHQNKTFYTIKHLPFKYYIKGGEIFVDRRSKSITRATFSQALQKIKKDPEKITGPKSLNVFGAPYVWAILKEFKIV